MSELPDDMESRLQAMHPRSAPPEMLQRIAEGVAAMEERRRSVRRLIGAGAGALAAAACVLAAMWAGSHGKQPSTIANGKSPQTPGERVATVVPSPPPAPLPPSAWTYRQAAIESSAPLEELLDRDARRLLPPSPGATVSAWGAAAAAAPTPPSL